MEIATRVGLQLLLDPTSSGPLFRAGCATVGVIYPVYESFKALENSSSGSSSSGGDRSRSTGSTGSTSSSKALPSACTIRNEQQWLTYWSVYGLFTLLENQCEPLLRYVPYYYHAKFGFLLWLMMPQTQGARCLYEKLLQPTLRRYQPKIDVVLTNINSFALALYGIYQVPIQAAVSAAWAFVAWFTDVGDGDKSGSNGSDKKSQFISR